MVDLIVYVVVPEDLEEVPHNRSPECRERLTADRDGLAFVLIRVMEYDP